VSKKILIVDDQENWRQALSSVLWKSGYSVETADSLKSARETLEKDSYALIVTDIRLVDERTGDVSGLELLAELKTTWEKTGRPCLIIMTGYLIEGIEELALSKFEADCFFPKNPPEGFKIEDFRRQVERLLARKG
jgi:DNA-binding NtrC family response regulator